MKKRIGILPASGKASRISGIPKFCLPIANDLTLLKWHLDQMKEVTDEVRIATRKCWLPILDEMNIKDEIIILEPSTMSDAIYRMATDNEELIIGMPDTYINDFKGNIYQELFNVQGDIVLGLWECESYLKGKVGQIEINPKSFQVTSSVDKNMNCNYQFMWGIIRLNIDINLLDRSLSHPGLQFQSFIDQGYDVKGVPISGKYFDLGNFSVLKELYSTL